MYTGEVLESIFLMVESRRLEANINWSNYLNIFYSFDLWDSKYIIDWISKIRNLLYCFDLPNSFGLKNKARLGYKMGGISSLYAALFPGAAFAVKQDDYLKFYRKCLGRDDSSQREYLKLWAKCADPSLESRLQDFGLSLEAFSLKLDSRKE